ncbi:GTP-binding protein [Flavobacterium sp. ACAM 123]|uniref:GTP-binding protein n=1 Tax=Flavobacterium sp. ACAM 123 TaxID=1189620 RepID=UPI0012F854B2|nr:GTP-binding protein [Flavobacterium sp. ACAM 123]
METKNDTETHIRGLFGPNPTLWTLFMFLHFIIAGVFLIFSRIAYSDYVLKNSRTFDFIVIGFMVFAWFLLYYITKQIRENGHDQMTELETLFLKIIAS